MWSTVVTLTSATSTRPTPAVDAAWESVVAELHRVDRVFSTFRDDSVISRLRRGGQQVVADDVAEVIDRCLEARRLTDGAFDPWAAPGGFDPSGLVKGWAADRCADIVRQHGFRSFTLDAGGDLDVPRRSPRRRRTTSAGPSASRTPTTRCDRGGRRRASTPRSRRPASASAESTCSTRAPGEAARGARQATVVGTDGALADALATALLVPGRDGARWFAALPGWSAHVVDGGTTTAWGPAFTTSIPTPGGEER